MAEGLWASLKTATVDFYYHSVRLVVANLVWGVAFFVVLSIAVAGAPLVALTVAPLLAVPWVGVVRLASLIARGDDVVLSDAFEAWRRYLFPALAGGAATTLAIAILAWNVLAGLDLGNATGWAFSTFAAWGLVALVIWSLAFWPLLVDPRREGRPLVETARGAALLVLAHPARLGALAAILVTVGVASAILASAIATFALAWIALVAARVVLPLADRVEMSPVPLPLPRATPAPRSPEAPPDAR
ncbi:MAG TPA: hypothetical protein VH723_10935 [Candidatus Limnocylindrales bacterium]|jgi:hypothetical protein